MVLPIIETVNHNGTKIGTQIDDHSDLKKVEAKGELLFYVNGNFSNKGTKI